MSDRNLVVVLLCLLYATALFIGSIPGWGIGPKWLWIPSGILALVVLTVTSLYAAGWL